MSSGNGDGGGFFDNIVNVDSLSGKGNFFENLTHDVVNGALQYATAGTLGYENGKLSNGVTTNVLKNTGKAVVSGVKEVTGAKAAEEANAMARDQFEEQKAASEASRVAQINQNAKDQVQQSNNAQAARGFSAPTRTTNKTLGSTFLGADEKDFLGL